MPTLGATDCAILTAYFGKRNVQWLTYEFVQYKIHNSSSKKYFYIKLRPRHNHRMLLIPWVRKKVFPLRSLGLVAWPREREMELITDKLNFHLLLHMAFKFK